MTSTPLTCEPCSQEGVSSGEPRHRQLCLSLSVSAKVFAYICRFTQLRTGFTLATQAPSFGMTSEGHKTPDGRVLHSGAWTDITYVDHWLILCGEALENYSSSMRIHLKTHKTVENVANDLCGGHDRVCVNRVVCVFFRSPAKDWMTSSAWA